MSEPVTVQRPQAMPRATDIDHQPDMRREWKRSSFYWPIRLLSPKRRQALQTLYAFCRHVDDAVDHAPCADSAIASLRYWQTQLALAYLPSRHTSLNAGLLDPCTRELQRIVRRYQLPRIYFDNLLHGQAMDATQRMIAPSEQELRLYCYRVASCVGLLTLGVLECDDMNAETYAIALGHALQLTNILRDVAQDLDDHRLYIPRNVLIAHGVDFSSPDAVRRDPNLGAAMQQVRDDAKNYYQLARRVMSCDESRRLRPIRMMHVIYETMLDNLPMELVDSAPPPPIGHGTALKALCQVMLGLDRKAKARDLNIQ